MTARNGSADWHGDVRTGSGTITIGDGVFSGPYSYDSRFGDHQGTNPEQLIAAAQAGCFTMALASKLASGGHPPDLLRTNATVHLRMLDGSIALARLEIETEGRVKGIDDQQFSQYAEDAKATCPVARALSGIPEIVLKAQLTDEGSRSITRARRWRNECAFPLLAPPQVQQLRTGVRARNVRPVASAVGEGSIAVSVIQRVLQRS